MAGLAPVLLAVAAVGSARAGPPTRVLSLDQCADQYLLALADRQSIVGVSPLASGADSHLRDRAIGLPRRRATLESVLGARPQVVLRSWTPDARLAPALRARGVTVVQLDSAEDFDGIRRNVRTAAAALGRPERGDALVRGMDAALARASGAWASRPALYLTPSGFTAGPGTLSDAMLRAAGLTNSIKRSGYQPVPLEKLALSPPPAVVLGFFDPTHVSHWYVGRRPLVQELARTRAIASVPSDLLLCPAWFTAEAVSRIAAGASRRP